MKKLLFAVSVLLIGMLNAQTNIAVMDFEGKNVSKADASALTDRLRAELFLTGKFVVLEREKMDAILKEQQFQLSGCTSDACAVEAGQLLAVEQIVSGSVSKVGQTFSVTARLIDVEKGNLLGVGTCDLRSDIGDLMNCLTDVAAQLSRKRTMPIIKQKIRSAYSDLLTLYQTASQDYELGDFDTFKLKMAIPEKRKIFYDAVSENYELGSFSEFEQRVINCLSEVSEPVNQEITDSTVLIKGSTLEKEIQTGTVTDIDGNTYKTVKIGDQWWMAENLKVTHYRNGDAIPKVTNNNVWSGLSTGAYCEYDNNSENVVTYGRLYNWYAVNDSRNIAPTGWHVPTDAEWQTLVDFLGGEKVAGGKLKEAGKTHWYSPNAGANNGSGFAALPGGHRNYNYGFFHSVGCYAAFWSSTELTSFSAWYRYLFYLYSEVPRHDDDKRCGFSVRCVMD